MSTPKEGTLVLVGDQVGIVLGCCCEFEKSMPIQVMVQFSDKECRHIKVDLLVALPDTTTEVQMEALRRLYAPI